MNKFKELTRLWIDKYSKIDMIKYITTVTCFLVKLKLRYCCAISLLCVISRCPISLIMFMSRGLTTDSSILQLVTLLTRRPNLKYGENCQIGQLQYLIQG